MVIFRETLFIDPVQFNLLHCCIAHRQTDKSDIGYCSVSLTKTNHSLIIFYRIVANKTSFNRQWNCKNDVPSRVFMVTTQSLRALRGWICWGRTWSRPDLDHSTRPWTHFHESLHLCCTVLYCLSYDGYGCVFNISLHFRVAESILMRLSTAVNHVTPDPSKGWNGQVLSLSLFFSHKYTIVVV